MTFLLIALLAASLWVSISWKTPFVFDLALYFTAWYSFGFIGLLACLVAVLYLGQTILNSKVEEVQMLVAAVAVVQKESGLLDRTEDGNNVGGNIDVKA